MGLQFKESAMFKDTKFMLTPLSTNASTMVRLELNKGSKRTLIISLDSGCVTEQRWRFNMSTEGTSATAYDWPSQGGGQALGSDSTAPIFLNSRDTYPLSDPWLRIPSRGFALINVTA